MLSVLGFLCFRSRSSQNKQKVPRARVFIPPESEEGKEVISSGNLENGMPASYFTPPHEMPAAARKD